MSYKNLLGLLLPPRAYDPNGQQISAELTGEGNALQAAEEAANQVALGIVPLTQNELIPDWERVLGLTPSPVETMDERLLLIKAKLNELGGLSIPYFINLAKSLGYTITIDEPQPFRAGVNRAGDRLFIEEIIWVWQVNVYNHQTEALDIQLVAMFNDLKPAHTFVMFNWDEAQ